MNIPLHITGHATLLITLNIKVNRAMDKTLKEAAHHSRLKTWNTTLHKILHTTLRINTQKALHKDLVNPTNNTNKFFAQINKRYSQNLDEIAQTT